MPAALGACQGPRRALGSQQRINHLILYNSPTAKMRCYLHSQRWASSARERVFKLKECRQHGPMLLGTKSEPRKSGLKSHALGGRKQWERVQELGTQSGVSCMLGKCATLGLYLQPCSHILTAELNCPRVPRCREGWGGGGCSTPLVQEMMAESLESVDIKPGKHYDSNKFPLYLEVS